jgi:hypothetical protein
MHGVDITCSKVLTADSQILRAMGRNLVALEARRLGFMQPPLAYFAARNG